MHGSPRPGPHHILLLATLDIAMFMCPQVQAVEPKPLEVCQPPPPFPGAGSPLVRVAVPYHPPKHTETCFSLCIIVYLFHIKTHPARPLTHQASCHCGHCSHCVHDYNHTTYWQAVGMFSLEQLFKWTLGMSV